jgi:undecaprenyl-diphosphatase
MFSQFQALVLGSVQGLTEFLPISSSAHLAVLPWLLRWRDPGLAFDVALHLGTLMAVLVYYWRDWLDIALSLFGGRPEKRRLLLLIIVASIPGAIFGALLEKQAETVFRSPLLIAVALAAMGVLLWAVDHTAAQKRTIGEIGFIDALVIGTSQALALVPGVSRSGVTITAARWMGMRREDAANFSFLVAAPIIGGAGIVKAKELFHITERGLGVGFVAAAVFGLLAITVLIRFVRSRSYEIFAWYRIAAAALIVAVYFARG